LEDIRFIDEAVGLDTLSSNLQEIARVRLENPDTPLKDLGNLLDPPVGKSGVNHRLRRISEIADRLREERFQEDLS
jgi:DNA-binding protein WhiA